MCTNFSRIKNTNCKVTVIIKSMVNNKENPLKSEQLKRCLVLSSLFNKTMYIYFNERDKHTEIKDSHAGMRR